MNNLLKQFQEMGKIPIMEIPTKNADYEIFEITADEKGLYTDDFFVEWDTDFTLDEHLQCLYTEIVESLIEEIV